MTTILGIDPGSRKTGFGLIDTSDTPRYIASGCIKTSGTSFPERLKQIVSDLEHVVLTYQPDVIAVERVFVHRNAGSALKLGQARGAALAAVLRYGLEVFEYAPREIKLGVVGYGGATKDQINHMVCTVLQLPAAPQEDAADALAIALCHHQTYTGVQKFQSLLQR